MKLPKILASAGSAMVIAGCQSNAEYFENKRIEEVRNYFEQQATRVIPMNKTFSLEDCIQAALENNLDLKIEKAKKEISDTSYVASVLGMLPKLNGSYDVTERDRLSISKSSKEDGTVNDQFNYSARKKTETMKLEAVFSVVDFGMSYYNAQQADDRSIFNDELGRRTQQNLAYEISQAYYDVAVAQAVMTEAEELIRKNDEMENRLDLLTEERTVAPMQAVSTGIDLLSVKQRLKDYRRNYNNSCIRLSNLMGFTSANALNLRVDTTMLNTLPTLNLPEIQTIETLALENRPELFQSDINAHIAALETRKAIVSMFPNASLSYSFNKTDNPFTKYSNWRQIGMNSVLDFFSLPSKYYEYKVKTLEESMMDERTLNLSIGIVSQVHMAHANIMESVERYKISEKIFNLGQKKFQLTQDKQNREGAVSAMALLQTETQTHLYNIARLTDMAAVHVAYSRLLNSVGTTDLAQTPVSLAAASEEVVVEETPIVEEVVEAAPVVEEVVTEEVVEVAPVVEEVVTEEVVEVAPVVEEAVTEEVVEVAPVVEETAAVTEEEESGTPWYNFWSSNEETSSDDISVEDLENEVNSWADDMGAL